MEGVRHLQAGTEESWMLQVARGDRPLQASAEGGQLLLTRLERREPSGSRLGRKELGGSRLRSNEHDAALDQMRLQNPDD